MSKSRMLLILIGLWLFAIAAPSVISLIEVDKPVIVNNLNEEEQNKQGEKSVDEIKVVPNNLCDFSLISRLGNTLHFKFYLAKSLNASLEIFLPPPEHS